MDNPENLEILKILVQTNADAVQSAILYLSTLLHLILHTCATAAHVRVSDVANQRHTTITRKLAILTYAIGALPLFTNNEFSASAST